MNIIAYISDYQDEIDSLTSELSQEIKKETETIEEVESKEEDINEDNAKDFKTDKIFNCICKTPRFTWGSKNAMRLTSISP